MNRDETDFGCDDRLVNALRECLLLAFDKPKFDLGAEIARANRCIAELERARMADDCHCPVCGKRGIRSCNC